MAHEISITGGKAEMAFVGMTPWHGLGQRVTRDASIETWQREAGMEWDAKLGQVRYTPDAGSVDANGVRDFPGQSVIYRGDTGAPLAVVSDGYKIVQPKEVLEFFRDLTEQGGWHIHTAGVLRGGRKLWALASNHTEGEVVPGDRVRGNLLLATSLDGSLATTVGMTAIRVVCANTLRVALSTAGLKGSSAEGADAAKEWHRTSHRSVFNADAAKRHIGVARESFEMFMERARVLADSPIAVGEAREVLRSLFGQPAKIEAAPVKTSGFTMDGSEFKQLLARPAGALAPAATTKERENRNVVRVLELFGGAGRGATHQGSEGTKWGLLNAVTEFVDHERGRSSDVRLDNAWFGEGANLKADALKLLTA